METKAFSLQSPEQIAKDYEGNKQKIAQAAHMGLLDPTAAVMAGMFIDRMRSAQVMEQAPTQTIAQQVLAPSGPPPQGSPTATPPQMPPQGQPMGMASGGVASLSIPDNMFDEPADDAESYAGGGLVSFASGGGFNFPSTGYEDADALLPRIMMAESGGNPNAVSSAGALGLMQLMPGTASDPGFGISPAKDGSPQENLRVGSQYFGALRRKYGNVSDALMAYNWGPGNMDRWIASGRKGPVPEETSNYVQTVTSSRGPRQQTTPTTPTPVEGEQYHGRAVDLQEGIKQISELRGPQSYDDYDAYREDVRKINTPEERDRRKKQDLWSTLAQIGFNMAGSNSPSFLQAAGQAGAAALPGMMERTKDRRTEERDALRTLAATEAQKRAEGRDEMGQNLEYVGKTQASADNLRASEQQHELGKDRLALERQQLAQQAREAELDRKARRDLAALQEGGAMARARLQAEARDPSYQNRLLDILIQAEVNNIPPNKRGDPAEIARAQSTAATKLREYLHAPQQTTPGLLGADRLTPQANTSGWGIRQVPQTQD